MSATTPRPWKVVAINAATGIDFGYEHEALAPLGVTIQRVPAGSDEAIIAAVADADVVMPAGYRIGRAVIQRLGRCRLIPSGGIGVDHIDVEAASEQNILVTNMADTFVEEVANHTWMLLLMTARRGRWLHDMATSNRWNEALGQLFPVLQLSMPRVTGQVLGLISFGRIARAVARRAHAFGMSVVAYDPFVPASVFAEHGVEAASLDAVCRRADFVSCHLPWSASTTGLVNEAAFQAMKPSAIFLSTGRGKVVDEAALIRALQAGRLAGAGLDVLEQEPPSPDNPLLHMPNVVVTPHMASVSDVSYVARRRLIGRQVADVLLGTIPVGVVNSAVLEHWPYRRSTAADSP